MLDRLTAHAEGGFRTVDTTLVQRHAAGLHAEAKGRLTAELRESPEVLAANVERRLASLGMVRVDAHTRAWTFTPLAGRYRDARLETAAESAPADLFGSEGS